ncbi:phage virion morphogenesis protein [Serratia liquefaciens]|uniref:phage virion morphogenesis protein n=1 Tax=Serratia liquefaciens TaxID=614 RepID=UPI003B3A8F15
MQRIARVYHYGLREQISVKGPQVRYAERCLLGINSQTEKSIASSIIRWLHKQ